MIDVIENKSVNLRRKRWIKVFELMIAKSETKQKWK